MHSIADSPLRTFLLKNPLIVLLILLVVGVQLSTGSLLTWQNMRGVLLDASVIAIAAVPCALLIIAGYIDLSVGASLALGGVVAGHVMHGSLASAPLAVVLAMAAGALVGLVNAVLSTVLGLSPFITTLGMLTAVRGADQLLSPLPLSGFDASFQFLGIGSVAGIPVPVIIATLVMVLATLFLAATPAGRHVYAIGVSREAAFLSGIAIRRIPFFLYVASGAMAALAGAVTAARLNSAPAGQLGLGFELTVLTAILLGGIALTGGEGSMLGVLVGVLFLGLLGNSLTLLGVTSFWQNVASGLALVAAIGITAATHEVRKRVAARRAQLSAPATGPAAPAASRPESAEIGS
ncbi:ribonucleotide-diphosphate reductase subunit alpha [Zafaria cholistanensis]|uniref:Ribonucleotide-diphosphate reductase subunit alpha n=1 Tax=Zafaria cholistanensis TaxID=1682741 RepID=A0A5A7NSI3_9MICC|nr:ABC transporter permease [Zafaria cholistanensis]GER23753.1 ribonucleotide-diphosphate reductase subunit alpha [Zafaria cholistanensis]